MRTVVDATPEPRRQTSRACRWYALALGSLTLVWFAFVFLPAVIGYLQGDLARVIEQRGLEPDGLFYTETDEVGEAYNYLGNSALGSAPNAARSRE